MTFTLSPPSPPGPGVALPTQTLSRPGSDLAVPPTNAGGVQTIRDLYPTNESDHMELVSWCNSAFRAADSARMPHKQRWDRHYRLYRSYVKRLSGSWQSQMFYPLTIATVQTILPRLAAALPKAIVNPIGPEDELCARLMEELLEFCAGRTGQFLQQVLMVLSALIYGTGIGKSFLLTDIKPVPISTPPTPVMGSVPIPSIDPGSGQPMPDGNGGILFETRDDVTSMRPGTILWEPRVVYAGPAVEQIDLENFWVSPEASEIQTARYTIERRYREYSEIKQRIAEGVYRLPKWVDAETLIMAPTDEPLAARLGSIGRSSGSSTDPTRRPCEVLEFHDSKGRVLAMLNRMAIVRCEPEPFAHGMKPYVKVVDHITPNEFYGIGEAELLEGLQDQVNILSNKRVDAVKLSMNPQVVIKQGVVVDARTLVPKPGGVVEYTGDFRIDEAIQWQRPPDVTQTAFAEVRETLAFAERVTAVTPYQIGQDQPSMNDTATGASLMSSAGDARFGLKTRLQELGPWQDLARMSGSIIQQFWPKEQYIKILDPVMGEYLWTKIDPSALAGNVDYQIEVQSSGTTERQRRQEALQLIQVLGPILQNPQNMMIPGIRQLVMNVLQAFGYKNVEAYVGQAGSAQMQVMMQQMIAAGQGEAGYGAPGAGGGPPAPGAPAAPPGPPAPPMPPGGPAPMMPGAPMAGPFAPTQIRGQIPA